MQILTLLIASGAWNWIHELCANMGGWSSKTTYNRVSHYYRNQRSRYRMELILLLLSNSYFPGITHNAGKMLNEPTSLHRFFFDRGTNITASEDPNGMTNGETVDFVSFTNSSTLQNFTTDAVTGSTLPSKVDLFSQQSGYSSSTAAQSSSTGSINKVSFNANENGSDIASPLHFFSCMVFALLVTITMYF